MKLIIVRHAETNYNVQHLTNYNAGVDVHLTERGERQAEKLAEVLREVPIDVIFVSRLKRTKQTAEIVNRQRGILVVEDGRLDDVYNGFEGRPVSEAKAWRNSQPDPVRAKLSEEWESVQDVNKRVRSFLRDVAGRDEETILVVTSSHLMKHFRMINGEGSMDDVLGKSAQNVGIFEMEVKKGEKYEI